MAGWIGLWTLLPEILDRGEGECRPAGTGGSGCWPAWPLAVSGLVPRIIDRLAEGLSRLPQGR